MTDQTSKHVDVLVAAAKAAADPWAATPTSQRAAVLEAVAAALDAAGDMLVPLAMHETHLPEGRLIGELKRTTFQLRLLGEAVADGGSLGLRVDRADPDWPMGAPRPDLRRIKVPVGPVVVFAGGNFPFAFSILGGDTASALAAGCPVIVKAHPGHLGLSRRVAKIAHDALRDAGAPNGVLTLIEDQEDGVRALQHPDVAAGAFTGSIAVGRALFDIASRRPQPIPFYGELGSVNPVFVTAEAATELQQDVVRGFLDSVTLGVGQFCTKPGMLIAPRSAGLPARLAATELPGAATMLSSRMLEGYRLSLEELIGDPAIEVVTGANSPPQDGAVTPTVLRADVQDVINTPRLQEECFGPAALVVEYDEPHEMVDLAAALPGQLTATLWGTDESDVAALLPLLVARAGRVLWNQWPTGVSVTHAQQHGGPYPATTAPGTTSVGTAAVERFLRPVAFQNFPQRLLPPELRDDSQQVP